MKTADILPFKPNTPTEAPASVAVEKTVRPKTAETVAAAKGPTLTEAWLKAIYAAKLAGKPGPAEGYQLGDTEPGCAAGLRAYHATDNSVNFRIRVKLKGKDRTEKLGTYDPDKFNLKAARKKANWTRCDWEQNGMDEPAAVLTLDEVFAEWHKLRVAKDPLVAGRTDGVPADWEPQTKRFREMMALGPKGMDTPVTQLKRTDITDAKAAWMAKEGKNDDRCLRHMFAIVIPVLDYAHDQHKMAEMKKLRPRGHAPRTRFLLPGEIQKAYVGFQAVPDRAGLFPEFLLMTGMRVMVAAKFRWQDIDARERTFTYNGREERMAILRVAGNGHKIVDPNAPVMKGKKSAVIPIVGDALLMLDAFKAASTSASILKDPCVFPLEIRRKWRDTGNGTRYHERMDEASGLAGWHRHDLRRTFATYLKYCQLPQAAVSLALSHATTTKKGGTEAAAATSVYTRDDTENFDLIGTDEELDAIDMGNLDVVAVAIMRAQELFRQMRDGTPSPYLKKVQDWMAKGDNARAMMTDERHPVDPALIDVVESAE